MKCSELLIVVGAGQKGAERGRAGAGAGHLGLRDGRWARFKNRPENPELELPDINTTNSKVFMNIIKVTIISQTLINSVTYH